MGFILSVQHVEHQFQSGPAASFLENIGHTQVLGADRGGENVQVGQAYLEGGDLEGRFGIVLDQPGDVPERGESQLDEQRQERKHRNFLDFSLIERGDAPVERVERAYLHKTAERISVQRNLIEIPGGDEILNFAAVFGDFGTDTAELVVCEFEHSGQTAHIAEIKLGNLHSAFVARIVAHIRPGVLEDRTDLDLETDPVQFGMLCVLILALRDTADVVNGKVAEGIDFVEFPLVHGILPVDFEQPFHNRGHLVHVIRIESDHPESDNIGNIGDAAVLVALELEFSLKRLLGLDPVFDGRYDYAGIREELLEFLRDKLCHFGIDRHQFPVLVKEHFRVDIIGQTHRHNTLKLQI